MARYTPDAQYIASIFPSALERIVQYHGPEQNTRSSRCTVYQMPRVLRGQQPELPDFKNSQNLARVQTMKISAKNWCAVMEIPDAFENVPDIAQEWTGKGQMPMTARPIRCEHIAQNLITTWAHSITGLPSGAAPGMMVIGANTTPTQEQIEQMHAMQNAFYEFRLAEGDKLFNLKNLDAITQQMKDAAIYLNKERTWSGAYGAVGTVDCPHCFSPVHPRATVCPHCRRDMKSAEEMAAEQKIVVPPAGKNAPVPATV